MRAYAAVRCRCLSWSIIVPGGMQNLHYDTAHDEGEAEVSTKVRIQICTCLAALGVAVGIFLAREPRKIVMDSELEGCSQPPRPSNTDNSPAGFLEPLSLAALRKRIDDVFSGGYLTALAIIQGVALGLLLSIGQQQWILSHTFSGYVTVVTQAVSVFVVIVIVTHRYLLLTMMARWMPTVFDTLIPFALGSGEILTALLIGHRIAWWGGVLVFSVAAAGAYLHTRIRISSGSFGNLHQIYVRMRRVTGRALATMIALGVLSTTILIVNQLIVYPTWFYMISPLIYGASAMVIALTGNYRVSTP